MSLRRSVAALAVICFFLIASCGRQDAKNNSKEEQAIRSNAEAYTEAYNKHDAAALTAFWSDDAVYVNPETGKSVTGRQAIQEEFEDLFNEDDDKTINIKILSIHFPQPDKAVESGVVKVTNKEGEISQQAYRVFYDKINGKWLIRQVREIDVEDAPEENEQLKELSWLIGNWVDEDEDSLNEITTTWDKHKNFIIQAFSVSVEGFLELEGKQLIAWDPVKREIHSWIFDSDGSFGEGTWSKEGKSWIADMTQTMSDGQRGSATYIYTPVDANSYTWQATEREVGGDFLPDIDPVTVKRKAGVEK